MKTAIIFCSVILVLFVIYERLIHVVRIIGSSMEPTYHEGEILIATSLFTFKNLSVGDIIVFKEPEPDENGKRRLMIKRIAEIDRFNMRVFCVGDNYEQSYDSRQFGWIHASDIKGRVTKPREYKYSY